MISVTVTSDKRAIAVCAPTGFGKSDAVVAGSIISGEPTCIITSSKGLQDQYLRSFAHLGLVDLRGKRNYPCSLKPDYTCEEGSIARCPCRGTIDCPSSQAEMRAASSRLVVTNYAKWCASRKNGQGLSHITRVVFDEAHFSADALSDAMQVILNYREVNDKLEIDFPSNHDDMGEWKLWAAAAKSIAEVEMMKAKSRIDGVADPRPGHVRHYTHMRNLCRRLSIISSARARDWIVDEIPNMGFQFDPIRPARYAESALLFRVPKLIFVSATIRPKSMAMIGISKENYDFIEFNSDFDAKRCPIYYVPTIRVDSKNRDLTLLWRMYDRLAARRQDRKGITLTTSYQYQQAVLNNSRFRSRMILNNQGEATTDVIEKYLDAGAGSILVSPSVSTGYDFPGKACEWQFFCKLPFDPPSKILKAREQDDPEYRPYRTMNKFVQGCGRGMRSKTDQCEVFIGDQHCDWFIPRYRHLAPRSFHGFFKTVYILPDPPQRLP